MEMEKELGENRRNLKLLSIFHYVFGGLTAALSLFSLLHIGVGLTFILGSQELAQSTEGTPLPPGFGWIFLIAGLVWLVLGMTLAGCAIASGRFLGKRRRYRFSFVVACIECLFAPIGTVLGVFTIVLLSKESVKAMYGLDEREQPI